MLHPFKPWKNKVWCGPAAISALTGIDIGPAHSKVAFVTGENVSDVDETDITIMRLVLSEAGVNLRLLDVPARYPTLTHGPTLRRYMAERPISEKSLPTLIEVDGHWIVGHWDYLMDSAHCQPTHYTEFAKLGRLVKSVHLVVRKEP